jgi:hypothetical protein
MEVEVTQTAEKCLCSFFENATMWMREVDEISSRACLHTVPALDGLFWCLSLCSSVTVGVLEGSSGRRLAGSLAVSHAQANTVSACIFHLEA